MSETEDLIRRDDAIQALVDCDEIRGHAYVELMRALENIPAVKEGEDGN